MHVLDQQCPKCGATDCKLSRSGLLRIPAMLVGLRPIRCNRCHTRYWRFFPKVGGKPRVRGRKRSSRTKSHAGVSRTPPPPAA